MSRTSLVEMTRRTLRHALAETAPLAEGIATVPARNYVDVDRWQLELERIWRRVPLMLAPSCDLAAAGTYRALEVAGVPLLLTRAGDGVVRAFVNSCSHRGAIVAEEGSGSKRRFTCPYHAWTYDWEGTLVGVLDRDEFGPVDFECAGLTALPCEERAGLIFGILDPAASIDLDSFLVGYDKMLEHLGFDACRLVGRTEVEGPNWKIAYDGYLDFYHLPILHKNTFGPDYSNKAVFDAWGPHQRLLQPDHRVAALEGIDEDDWTTEQMTGGVWTIFPHVSVAGFDVGARMFMLSQLLPGSTPGTSTTVQHFLAPFEPDDAQQEVIDAQIAFLGGVVRDEDYFTGFGIQKGLATGAKAEVMFGRNESGGQRFHRWVDSLVEAETAADSAALFAAAQVIHQP